MSSFDKEKIKFLILFFKIGCFQSFSISNRGNKTKLRLCILGCGNNIPFFTVFLSKSKMSISQTLGEFFGAFARPNDLSMSLQI